MALVTLSEYARLHDLMVTNVRTARQRGKLATAVKQHGVWLVDDAEPWWRDRETDWFDSVASASRSVDEYDRHLMIRRHAACGRSPQTFEACLDAVPPRVRDALPVQDVAALVDAIHDSYEQGYNAALRKTG